MLVDDFVEQLNCLSLCEGRAVSGGNSKKLARNGKGGDDVIQKLRPYVERVRAIISKAGASSTDLKMVAKTESKGLLKVAQAGLQNTTRGTEPLRLACEAMDALVQLSDFLGAAPLVIEKLWYQAIARSVELGEYTLGLRASASLQNCLDTSGVHAIRGAKHEVHDPECAILRGSDEDDDILLRAFAPPRVGTSLETAKLVTGASLNTCRCCLEVGSRDALLLVTGELGHSAALWIGLVSERGDTTKADVYLNHLFKVLWRACSILEQPGLAAESEMCFRGRQKALEVLLRKQESWDTSLFLGYAHRAAVALERPASGRPSTCDVAKLSAFCLEAIRGREGQRWPLADAETGEEEADFHAAWVDWLQYSAGVQEKAGDMLEAQRLLQLAHEYVRRCWKQGSTEAENVKLSSCAAYAAVLQMHMAVMFASQHWPPQVKNGVCENVSVGRFVGKKPSKKGAVREVFDSSSPSCAMRKHISEGFEWLDIVGDAVESLIFATDASKKVIGTDAAAFLGVAMKAWRWAQKLCGMIAQWSAAAGLGGEATLENFKVAEWSELSVRGWHAVGGLSRKLAIIRKCAVGNVVDRMPPASTISELAVDSHLRAAHVYVALLSSAGQDGGTLDGKKRGKSQGLSAQDGARHALLAAEEVYAAEGDILPSQYLRRAGAGWFALGQSLLERAPTITGFDDLVKGCRLLERWAAEAECKQAAGESERKSPRDVKSEILRSTQLDLRLAKLSKALQDREDYAHAAAASARALTFCPELWCASTNGALELPAVVFALIERYVTCRLRCSCSDEDTVRGRASSANDLAPGKAVGGASFVAGDEVRAYLRGSEDLPAAFRMNGHDARGTLFATLIRRAVPSAATAWVLAAECRAYTAHLPLCTSEGADCGLSEARHRLSACVEGHRLATDAILAVCERDTSGLQRIALWKTRAHVLAARFEHDCSLVEREDGGYGDGNEDGCADLFLGVEHAASGASAATTLLTEEPSSYSPPALVLEGISACLRGLLLRDRADSEEDFKRAMDESLDRFHESARCVSVATEHVWAEFMSIYGTDSIADYLDMLEAHYKLYGDPLRQGQAAEIALTLGERLVLPEENNNETHGTARSLEALSKVGTAFQAAGFPRLGLMYSTVADAVLPDIDEAESRESGDDSKSHTAGIGARMEAARVEARVLRGLCMAEESDKSREGEETLLEARRIITASRSASSATAAYLECVVGMGLSWVYERSGRVAEAMSEVRQAVRLCHAWASTGGPLSLWDVQTVALSGSKGVSIHDEESGEPAAEEGLGKEYVDVSERIGHQGNGVALSSLWIPLYLQGLARIGRLWRTRGFGSKASGYLRQGCLASESLHAARFLRRCLMEEVEVATRMHRFSRADRLLRASQDLLDKEQPGTPSLDRGETASECAPCHVLTLASARSPGAVEPVAPGKRKGDKKILKTRGGKAKAASALTASVPVGGTCVHRHERALDKVELAAAEAALLRTQGDFRGSLTACERGEAALAPLIEAAGMPVSSSNLLTFDRVFSRFDLERVEGQGQGLGWRAVDALATLRLHRGRAKYLAGNVIEAKELFKDCAGADGVTAIVRATAFYRWGRIHLDAGEAMDAEAPLKRAEALIRGAGAPKLVRKIRRALAVTLAALGCIERGVGLDATWRVAALSSLSIGVTHCNQVADAAAKRARTRDMTHSGHEASAGLRLFDVVSGRGAVLGALKEGGGEPCNGSDTVAGEVCLEDAVRSDLEDQWPIVSLCLAPGGEGSMRLLLTRLARGRPPLTATVPLSPDDTQLLQRWQMVMEENRDTLRGHSAEEAAAWGNKEKAAWWGRRGDVDVMVGALLHDLQERWLGTHGLAAVLLGEVVGERLDAELDGVVKFCLDRISAARRLSCPGSNEKGEPKANARRRGRAASTTLGGSDAAGGDARVGESQLPGGLAELVRVCVRGGEVVSERNWLEVVRVALSQDASEETAVRVARDIHGKVQATHAVKGVTEGGGGSLDHGLTNTPSIKDTSGKAGSSLDVERGRSADAPFREEASVRAAKPRVVGALGTDTCVEEMDFSKLKVTELRRELSARSIPATGLKRKSDLLARLEEAVRQRAEAGKEGGEGSVDSSSSSRSGSTAHTSEDAEGLDEERGVGDVCLGGQGLERHPVVLVLDEQLQAIPWEGLPCLRGRAVTRVPAVASVFSALATSWSDDAGSSSIRRDSSEESRPSRTAEHGQGWIPSRDGIRLHRGSYVLDPEANLPHTRKELGPVFRRLGRRLGWSGMEGEVPTEESMAQTLAEVDIFVYCGHGAGELLVGREAVAGLTQCAMAVLMGCSSGRLKGYGDFEPSGMVSSYLAGGSPAVVANLWDVTDRDIDRYSVTLLESLVGGKKGEGVRRARTLAHAVAEARSDCKMRFLVGHAPVCYGIPLRVAASEQVP